MSISKAASVLICIAALGAVKVMAQSTTAFTYQGRLNTAVGVANGSYDLTFSLYDANLAGNFIAGPITNSAVAVSNGLFSVTLDFGGGVFTGTNYWAQIGVRVAGGGNFATLVPRQQLTPAPYALALVSPQATALCPPGSVMAYMGTNAPNGWLLCDGSAVSRTQYAALFAVLGTASGVGDAATTFNLPDMRGEFLRGVDKGSGQDPDTLSRSAQFSGGNAGDAIGTVQSDATRAIPDVWLWRGSETFNGYYSGLTYNGVGSTQGRPANWPEGSETRPKNLYVNYIIKY